MAQVLSEVMEPQVEKKKKARVLEERLLDTPYEADEQPQKDEEKNDENSTEHITFSAIQEFLNTQE